MGMSVGSSVSAATLADRVTTVALNNRLALSPFYQELLGELAVGCVFAESSAGLTLTAAQADYFSLAAGKESTINTVSTTAVYSNPAYVNAVTVTEAHGVNLNVHGSAAPEYSGVRITILTNPVQLKAVTQAASNTSTTAYLYDTTGTVLIASATFSGSTATFSSPPTLAVGTSYVILVGKGGSNYTYYENDSASYPYDGTTLNWVSGFRILSGVPTPSASSLFSIVSLTVSTATGAELVTAPLPALNGTYSVIRLHPYGCLNPAGFTFDVDFTGGGTYSLTNQPIDAWCNLGGGTALNGAIIRINLPLSGSLTGYAVMVD